MGREFYGRTAELRVLSEAWQARGGQIVLLWGRRRVGKSYLLSHFGQAKATIHYTATERSARLELEAFSARVRETLRPGPRDALSTGAFTSWDQALRYLADASADKRLLVVLDELSYLIESDPSLPSVIQRFWDEVGRASKLRLVLCGSATTILEGLAEERSPLFGRFNVRLQLNPFSYAESASFHPGHRAQDLARVYGVLGGMPLYLSMWKPAESVRANLLKLFALPASPLLDEGELVLRTELGDAAGYFRLMSAVASGRTTYSGIKDVVGMEPSRGLDRLLAMRLLERRVPVTQDPDRTRVRRYRIADNFLAFWFRFIYPNRGEIERGLGPQILDGLVLPRIDDHMGGVFEEMARDYVRSQAPQIDTEPITRVGSWWTPDGQTEIDVVALSKKSVVLAGEVKWSKKADHRDLRALQSKLNRLDRPTDNAKLALFARESFEGVDEQSALLVNAADLYYER